MSKHKLTPQQRKVLWVLAAKKSAGICRIGLYQDQVGDKELHFLGNSKGFQRWIHKSTFKSLQTRGLIECAGSSMFRISAKGRQALDES